ncbi:CaiF/GrlA family transcriptional regulator, partial [Salmonella enterica subsp. enterica serovar Dublin]
MFFTSGKSFTQLWRGFMCPDNTHAKKQYLTPGNDIHYP